MKWAAFLFGIYILVLSAWPCADVHAGNTGSGLPVMASGVHRHQPVPGDICSPLCCCHCCNTAATDSFQCLKFSTPKPLINVKVLLIPAFSFADGYDETIWQPPRVPSGL